jgi:hypothetical protein
VRTIHLEILRPGQFEGLLLSPLTTYIAICNDNPPETFTIPYDHRTVLDRLTRLRYEGSTPAKEGDVREAAEIARRVLEGLNGFKTTLMNEVRHGPVHVRLTLTAAELAIIPFELAYGPLALNGVSPFSVNTSGNVCLTRETRHFSGLQFSWWDGTPKVLFAVASPDGHDVPERAHYLALRRALQDVLPADASPEDERGIITWLRSATLADLRAECERGGYSHVHILAHGHGAGPGEQRFGVRLHSSVRAGGETVDGNRLALALQPQSGREGRRASQLKVVTLAVCDSGNVGSVLYGDASLAHRLHEQEIPLVVASQFPMTFQGSAVFAEEFYTALLRGQDPRESISATRRALFGRCPDTHDWASLVAYAKLPSRVHDLARAAQVRIWRMKLDEQMSRLEATSEGERRLTDGLSRDDLRDHPELVKKAADLERQYKAKWVEVQGISPKAKRDALSTIANGLKRLSIMFRPRSEEESKEKVEERLLGDAYDAYTALFELEPAAPWIVTQKATADALRARSGRFDEPASTIRRFARLRCQHVLEHERDPYNRCDLRAQLLELAWLDLVAPEAGKVVATPELEEFEAAYVRDADIALATRDRFVKFKIYLQARQFRRYRHWWHHEAVDSSVERVLDVLTSRGIDIHRYLRRRDGA